MENIDGQETRSAGTPAVSEGHKHDESRNDSRDETQTAHPGSSINRINIRVDANALSLVALIFSVGALVALFMMSSSNDKMALKDQQIVDAKIAAGNAAVLEKVQAGIATAQATAQAGKEHARIALDEVQRANAQLEAKGLIRGSH